MDGAPKIGEARNVGCEYARGEIIAHWDDDDWSDAGRLADQIELLHRSGKPVVGYRSMRFTDGKRWWMYRGDDGYSLGTSLLYRKGWWLKSPFKPVQVGEDNAFVAYAQVRNALATADAGEMMHATVHPGNTWPRNLAASNFLELR